MKNFYNQNIKNIQYLSNNKILIIITISIIKYIS